MERTAEQTARRDKILRQFDRDFGPFKASYRGGIAHAYDGLYEQIGGLMDTQTPGGVCKAMAAGLLASYFKLVEEKQEAAKRAGTVLDGVV